MISKKEILNKMDEISIRISTPIRDWDDLRAWTESLPDDQPDALPFRWPVPDGMEVVTRDGREVEQLTKFDAKDEEFPLIGVLDGRLESWTIDGLHTNAHSYGQSDLFLRRKEKKVWVVDYADEIGMNLCFSMAEAKMHANKDSTIYEATLKPVV